MRLRSTHLLALLLTFQGAIAFAGNCSTRFEELLRSAVFPEKHAVHLAGEERSKLKSAWGKTKEARELSEYYPEIPLRYPSEPLIPVAEGAIAEHHPELITILDDIRFFQMDLSRFESTFLKNYRRRPNLMDYQVFYTSRAKLFVSGGLEWVKELRKIDPVKAAKAEKIISGKSKYLPSLMRDLGRHPSLQSAADEAAERASRLHGQIQGTLGELYGLVSFPNVERVSTAISDMPDVVKRIDERIAEVLARAKSDPEYYKKLKTRYPKIFDSKVMEKFDASHPGATTEMRLQHIRQWMRSKEIDFVRSDGNKKTWLELKSKGSIMTRADFYGFASGKSPRTQIFEDQEILEFLGMENEIQLEYFVTTGIEPEVKKELRDLGVRPLEYKNGGQNGTSPTVH